MNPTQKQELFTKFNEYWRDKHGTPVVSVIYPDGRIVEGERLFTKFDEYQRDRKVN